MSKNCFCSALSKMTQWAKNSLGPKMDHIRSFYNSHYVICLPSLIVQWWCVVGYYKRLSSYPQTEQPLYDMDWRSPGKKWVKTEGGWKPLSDLHNALGKHFRHISPSSGKSKSRDSPVSGISSPDFTCEEEKKISTRLRYVLSLLLAI